MQKHNKHPGGRPTVMTPAVLSKLEEAYAHSCTDVEACLFAEIAIKTLHRYQEKHPEFRERKEQLRQSPTLSARFKAARDAGNDTQSARWWLERKAGDEFNPKKRLQIQHDFKLMSDDRLLDEYKKLTGITQDSGEVIDAEIVDQIEHNPDDS